MKRYLKKSLSLLLALLMALSTMSVMVMAEGDAESEIIEETAFTGKENSEASTIIPLAEVGNGTCGLNLTWVLDDNGTLTISGTGDMGNYAYGYSPWYSLRDSIQTVVILPGATNVGKSAFANCENLIEVTIPDGVTSIGNDAFYNCSKLSSIALPDSVTYIDSWAFYNCQSLTSITIPEGVTEISSYAFYNCTNLTNILLPKSLMTMGYNLFMSCKALTTIYYRGSEAEWNAISIDEDQWGQFPDVTIYYNFAGSITACISVSKLSIVTGGIQIQWNTDINADGYNIFRSEDSGSTYKCVKTIMGYTTGSYIDTNVKEGITYYYYVQAYVGDFDSEYDYGKHITYQANFVTVPASISPESTYNGDGQNYYSSASPVYSYLETTNSGYMRVEYTGSNIAVEYYDTNFNITGKKYISRELSLFGGFYAGIDSYFLVFGETNSREDDNQEVIRVVEYSKDWERIGQASLYGANTTTPFSGGSCRMSESNGYLYLRTCHTMYTTKSDGLRHQANMTLVVRESDMSIVYSYYAIMNSSTGYVSHSFNQFILVDDDNNVIALDQGDAYPRSIILFKYDSPAGTDSFSDDNSHINVFPFQGDTGTNYTGSSIGGLEYSSSSYLVAGNSVTQDSKWSSHTARNIFITVTDRNQFNSDSTQIKWITNYDTDGSISASTPQLVKLESDKFILLWTTTENSAEKLHYVYMDGQGNTTSEIYTTDGYLSDCKPIVNQNGSVVWYVTGKNNYTSMPTFYLINSNGKLSTQSINFTGFAQDNGNWYYFENGITASTRNDVIQGTVNSQDGWWYVVNGQVQLNYTGVANYANAYGWWYIKNGKVDFSCNSVEQNDYGWWYVVGGQVQFGYTGVSNYGNAYGYWYIKDGKVDFSKTGIEPNQYGWWRVVNGQVDFSCNSVEQNDYGWWYLVGGQVQFDYTGVVNYANANGWWYVSGGKVDFSKTSIEQNNYGWWRVVGGKVDFSCNSVEENQWGWWYILGGQVQFGYTGVANYANAYGWWYIKDGKVDFSKTGVEQNNFGWWRVENGKVNFSFTGWATNNYGRWYCVNGKVDFSKS